MVRFPGAVENRHMTLLNAAVTRLGRVASVALSIAVVGGVALVVAGLFAPMYQTMSESSSGEVTHGTDTLIGVNGPGVLAVLGLPLLGTLAVGSALWHGARRGAVAIAWALAGLLAAFTVLAMASIGMFVAPITAAVLVACAVHRPRSEQPRAAERSAVVG
jgi:hypothetical protein